MTEIVDTLVTELAYSTDTKVLDKADKKLRALEKQSKATATATNVLADETHSLQAQLQDAAEAEQKLKRQQRELTKAIKTSKKPTDDQKRSLEKVNRELEQAQRNAQEFRNDLKRLGIQQAKIARQSRAEQLTSKKLSGARGQAGKRFEAAGASGGGGGGLAGVAAAAGPVGAALGGIAVAATGAAAAIRPIIEIGAEMEGLRARLKTVEGSVTAAGEAFTLLKGIARETPFELQDVTNAYVRLKSLGVQPTEASLKSFGNVAAAQGKPLIDFIEAVGDASTGEFERLKEFGIKASSQGEEVAFTFAGVTTRVGKNSKEINAFLEELGATKFAGAMADQMNTFNGVMSNAKDGFATFMDEIAKLGVLDEAKMILKEISGTMSDELAPIIAELVVGLLRSLRETLVELRDGGGGLVETFQDIKEVITLVMTVLRPLIALTKFTVAVFQKLFEVSGFLIGLINDLFAALGRLFDMLPSVTDKFEGLGTAWDKLAGFGSGALSAIDKITGSLFAQAEAIAVVKGSLADLQAQVGEGIAKLSDTELQALKDAGGESGAKAEAETRRRIKERESSEKKEEAAQRKDASNAKKKGRADEVAKRFDKLNDRQLASFASDPNVSKKNRDKAEKEQVRRAKKKKKKGASAGKKSRDATLVASIEKQIDKNARELAQAEAARGLRSGKLTAEDAGGFETRRFNELKDQQLKQFREGGRLPAGIAQDIRQVAALPSINDLAGRTQAPVISNTIIKNDFHDIQFLAEVTGEFATTPAQVSSQLFAQHRKQLHQLLGESVANFRTQEIR